MVNRSDDAEMQEIPRLRSGIGCRIALGMTRRSLRGHLKRPPSPAAIFRPALSRLHRATPFSVACVVCIAGAGVLGYWYRVGV